MDFSFVSIHELFLILLAVLLMVILMIFSVLLYGFYRYKSLSMEEIWSEVIDEKISETIVNGRNNKITNPNFKKWLKNSNFRNLFLEKLVSTENKFSGGAHQEIKQLFADYNLKQDALKKLKKKKSHLIAGGIQELTSMDYSAALAQISKFLHHPSPQVYHEAQYAMVVFKGFEGLNFLNDFPYIISDWQKLRLLRSINQMPEDCTEIVNNWLKSSNSSVVIFTLKLVRKFQMLSSYQEVKKLLLHNSTEIRIQTVRSMQALENASTIADLTENYEEQLPEVQLEILKVMKFSNDLHCLDFFKEQLLHHTSSAIRITAAKALINLGFQEYLLEIIEDESSPEQLKKIIKHAIQEIR